jgi:LytR cell envelope-related transcriptional attenuator
MSMLTPPGMGGKYKVTGTAYPRMRRPPKRRRRILVGIGALLVLSVLGWGTLELIDVFDGHHEASAASGSKCRAALKTARARSGRTAVPAASSITVNVYNATPRPLLAKHTAAALKKRGFKIGKVGDAPKKYDKKVTQSALLVGGPHAKAALSVLGAYLTGERSATDQRKDGSVDLMIGKAYKHLDPEKQATKALAALNKPAAAATPKVCHG